MTKPDFLYNQGMKILQYSELDKDNSWQRTGTSIAYYKNSIPKKEGNYYTLTFTITTKCIRT